MGESHGAWEADTTQPTFRRHRPRAARLHDCLNRHELHVVINNGILRIGQVLCAAPTRPRVSDFAGESQSSIPSSFLPVHDLRLATRPDVSRRPSLPGLLQARRDRESEGIALVVVWRELYWRSKPG